MLRKLSSLRKDIIATLWLGLAIFLALSLYSYAAQDPSWNSLGSSLKPLNWCGYLGSFLSDFLYQFFGMSSWVFVFFAFLTGVQTLFTRRHQSQKKYLWLMALLLTSAALCEIYFPNLQFYMNTVGIGGSIGGFLAVSLSRALNVYGATVFLATVFTISFLFFTDWTLGDILENSFKALHRVAVKVLQQFQSLYSLLRKIPLPRIRRPELQIPKIRRPSVPTIFSNSMEPFVEEEESVGEDIEENSQPEPRVARRRKVTIKKKVQRKIANWRLPAISMLEDPPATRYKVDEKEVRSKTNILLDKLSQFSVMGEVKGAKPGPAVTLYEFKPKADVKISKITELADDLSLALSSESVRIIAPIPGRDVVGIETSNAKRETVYLKDILADDKFWNEEVKLPLALGREANGTPKVVDLRRMPHLLVAGTTGSGKSVFVVCSLTGLLFRHSPKTLRLILIDPKQVDLSTFNDIPHLLMPIICEPKKAVTALKWAVKEMEKRYRSMSKFGARGLEAFNEKVTELDKDKIAEHEAYNQELIEQNRQSESYYFTPQPYIVVVVEEFGDLMAVDKSNVEQLVVRLAQMARASGIHLILAMQSPRKDVVTGLIKTNIPGRISFKVASKMDSRIILDESGGERLLARGDMLFLAPGVAKPLRHHGPWLTEDEINSVMEYWSEQGAPDYDETAMNILNNVRSDSLGLGGDFGDSSEDFDELYDDIVAWTATMKEVSASLIQRKFRIGYPRAARIIETLENEGVVGGANGSKPRQVLVNSFENPT